MLSEGGSRHHLLAFSCTHDSSDLAIGGRQRLTISGVCSPVAMLYNVTRFLAWTFDWRTCGTGHSRRLDNDIFPFSASPFCSRIGDTVEWPGWNKIKACLNSLWVYNLKSWLSHFWEIKPCLKINVPDVVLDERETTSDMVLEPPSKHFQYLQCQNSSRLITISRWS